MPLYEYQCDACGHRFEVIQKFSDPLEDSCPRCQGTVQKLFSSPAIQFKGSGFYITDYPKAANTSAAKVDAAKSDESGKTEKTEKTGKSETSATSGKAETATKSDKTSSDSSSSSSSTSGSSSTPAPSTSSASKKD